MNDGNKSNGRHRRERDRETRDNMEIFRLFSFFEPLYIVELDNE